MGQIKVKAAAVLDARPEAFAQKIGDLLEVRRPARVVMLWDEKKQCAGRR